MNDLTCVSNNAGVDDWGLGLLLQTKQIKKMVSSYVGENDEFARQFLEGELEVEFNPRAPSPNASARRRSIPSSTPPPASAPRSPKAGHPLHRVQGRTCDYIAETGIWASLALVKAWKADTASNLIYRRPHFNPMMATAAAFTIAEVERSSKSVRSTPTRSIPRQLRRRHRRHPKRKRSNSAPPAGLMFVLLPSREKVAAADG